MKDFLDNVLETAERQATRLMQILRAVQDEYHYIPEQAIDYLAPELGIPRTRITSVAEFYSFFHLQPRGCYEILISDSITDLMLGKAELMSYLSQVLKVGVGEVRDDGLVSLDNTSCTGMCDQGPAGLVNGHAITRLDKSRIDEMAALIERQTPLSEWPESFFIADDNIQKRGLLLQHPIERGMALRQSFARGMGATLDEIEKSGLRGRGGAGFGTAMKWRFCAEEQSDSHYVVCNADEGEPGTFKDRVLLNSYADQVFEGMTLCAAVIGAKKGFLYLRGEYRHLEQDLHDVLRRRREDGLLGENILGKGLDFDIEICMGAGAYICGEESALIESLEGKRGIPRNRPPYPVSQGYLNKPTVVNNVETFMAAAAVSAYGGDWFRSEGTEKSGGSKILSICGDCARPGIYEYSFGTSIEEIIEDCGGEDLLGIQIGGPSGTFVSKHELGRKLAFEDLATGGSFIVFNNRRNIFAVVRNFIHFFAHESCGFCTPCRVGTSLLKKQLDKVLDGHGSAGDVAELEELCRLVKNYSHCGLGQTAANPILSTLERYPDLYQHQLKQISYEPGFDLDGALETARRMARRDDAAAHLTQVED